MPILKLDADDEARELEFELDYQQSLSYEERLRMVLSASDELARRLIDSGQRRPAAIVKRPLR